MYNKYIYFHLQQTFSCYSGDGQQSQGRERASLALCTINITPDIKQNALYWASKMIFQSPWKISNLYKCMSHHCIEYLISLETFSVDSKFCYYSTGYVLLMGLIYRFSSTL